MKVLRWLLRIIILTVIFPVFLFVYVTALTIFALASSVFWIFELDDYNDNYELRAVTSWLPYYLRMYRFNI